MAIPTIDGLKYTVIPEVVSIDYGDFEDFVKDKLGFSQYDFVACEECGNDSTHRFNVGKFQFTDYDEKQLEEWRRGQFVPFTNGIILEELHRNGHIPAGQYVIEVCW